MIRARTYEGYMMDGKPVFDNAPKGIDGSKVILLVVEDSAGGEPHGSENSFQMPGNAEAWALILDDLRKNGPFPGEWFEGFEKADLTRELDW